MHIQPVTAREGPRRPRLRVADVLRVAAPRLGPTLDPVQRRALDAILVCRTPALGGFADKCDSCDHKRIAYCSCRNRHCPSCQVLRQLRWLEARMKRVLPTGHFHVVFTLPGDLRPLAACNRTAFYTLLFKTAARTLQDFARNPEHLGGDIGVTAVLHTWNRDLTYHPHVHCIVTGGALSLDGRRWLRPKRTRSKTKSRPFLFPVKAMAVVFRAKLLAGIDRLRRQGELTYAGRTAPLARDDNFADLVRQLMKKRWVVYAKAPFKDTEQLFRYLGQYTHRVGISDYRLRSLDEGHVTFGTRHGKTKTLDALEFARRFFQHVLPPHFTKVRHYGLYAATHVHGRLELARTLLSPQPLKQETTTEPRQTSWRQRLRAITGIDSFKCPVCEQGTIQRTPIPPDELLARPPPFTPC